MSYTYRHTKFACYLGYITQAIVNNLAPLLFIIFQNQYGISFEMIGRLILLNFGTQIVVDLLAVKYVDRIGYRTAAVAAHVFCAVGLVGLGIFPQLLPEPYLGLSVSVMLCAVGGGLIEVIISPIVEALPGDEKAAAMSLLHSFYCWGQMGVVLVSTLILWMLGTGVWMYLPILWALVPLYNLVQFTKVPLMPLVPEGEQKMPLAELFASKVFWIYMVLMVCAGASEITMSQWSSLFAEKGLRVSKVVGDLLGPCLFAVLMGIGRMLYGIFGSKINIRSALVASGALCIGCYLVTVFVQNPIVSLMGCAVCGLSVSLMWPGTISMTSARYPAGGTAMFGVLAVCGDLGASVGPWLAGVVSDAAQRSERLVMLAGRTGLGMDQLGLKTGLLLGIIFPVLLFIGVLMLRKRRDEQG